MPYKSFVIPAFHGEWAEREVNDFLRSHRVLAVDRRWVDQGPSSFWVVWIDYLESPVPASQGGIAADAKKRIDYREVLSPEDFEVFSGLRVLRKEIAEQDGVAVYNVLTNEQLAQIVQTKVGTMGELQKIPGIGDARIEKYGPRIAEYLNQLRKESDETGEGTAGSDSGPG